MADCPSNDDTPRIDEARELEFVAARQLLAGLLNVPEIRSFFDREPQPDTRMVYTRMVTIWMLVLQRLGKGLSFTEVVSRMISHGRDMFPDNKRVREETLSENTSAYSKARQRMPLDALENFSRLVCDHLARTSEPVFGSRRVFIIDGSTITLPPTPGLIEAFPPATNQHGTSVWPVAMLMVAHEMQSGCALLPQVDPMYGERNSSESRQAEKIVRRLPEKSIVLADSGFGIFNVAYHSVANGHDFLCRLTHARYKALRRIATPIEEGLPDGRQAPGSGLMR